jgi:hypothetical protein
MTARIWNLRLSSICSAKLLEYLKHLSNLADEHRGYQIIARIELSEYLTAWKH